MEENMLRLGIIDDNEQSRNTLITSIQLIIEEMEIKNCEVVGTAPLSTISDYFNWIQQENLSVLILDERLIDRTNGERKSEYNGHDLVHFFRQRLKDLPIFMITAVKDTATDELNSVFGDFESIMTREEYNNHNKECCQRFIRAGCRFMDLHGEQLIRLNQLSEKATKTELTSEEKYELRKIHEYLSLPFNDVAFKAEMLGELEKLNSRLLELHEKLNINDHL